MVVRVGGLQHVAYRVNVDHLEILVFLVYLVVRDLMEHLADLEQHQTHHVFRKGYSNRLHACLVLKDHVAFLVILVSLVTQETPEFLADLVSELPFRTNPPPPSIKRLWEEPIVVYLQHPTFGYKFIYKLILTVPIESEDRTNYYHLRLMTEV